MSQIRIKRESLDEIERELEVYRELIAQLEGERTLAPSTAQTYIRHADSFVRWLKNDFDPGASNKV